MRIVDCLQKQKYLPFLPGQTEESPRYKIQLEIVWGFWAERCEPHQSKSSFMFLWDQSQPGTAWAALSVSNHSSSDSPPFQKASDKMWARSNRRNDSKSLRRNWCMVRQHRAGADSSLTWGSCKKSWRMDFSTCSKFVLFGRQKVGTSPVQND